MSQSRKAKDCVVKVNRVLSADAFEAVMFDPLNNNGETIIVQRTNDSRINPQLFSTMVQKAGVGGILMLDQLAEDGTVGYVTRLKSAGENKRVMKSPALTIEILEADNKAAGRKIKIETPNELFACSRSRSKITVLVTISKGVTKKTTSVYEVIAELEAIFASLKNDSYTPKLILSKPFKDEVFELYGSRNKDGSLCLEKTKKYINDNDDLKTFLLQGGPEVIMLPSIVLRLSDLSAKRFIDSMLSATGAHGRNPVLERFFNATRLNGNPLFAEGVVVSQVKTGYEFGDFARILGVGRRLSEL